MSSLAARPALQGARPWRVVALTVLAVLAFAGNSLLCRLALTQAEIDPASFTSIRLVSGALALWVIVRVRRNGCAVTCTGTGTWASAMALFIYAGGFSFAYVTLATGAGALLLFGSVQTSMVGYGLWRGERLLPLQWVGLVAALAGLLALLFPGLSAPPMGGSLLMVGAGVAWGVYSLRGRGTRDPTRVTAGNFARATPFALGLSLLMHADARADGTGVLLALLSGTLTSGLGYAVWYTALPRLRATTAAVVQLSVPVLAAGAAIVVVGEPVTLRLLLASVAVLGGIAVVAVSRPR